MILAWAKRPNFWLLIATVVFFAAASISAGRMVAEQRTLFWSYRTGTWLVAEAQTEMQRTIIRSREFRIAPSLASLDALKVQFEVLWSRIPLILESDEGREIRKIPVVVANAERIAAALPALERALDAVNPAVPQSIAAFDAAVEEVDPLFDEMVQVVLVRDQVRDQANAIARNQWVTLGALIVAILTGFALIIGNLLQTRRIGRLYKNLVSSEEAQATKLMAIAASGDGIAMFSEAGVFEYSNEALRKLIGARIDRDVQLAGTHWRRFIHPESARLLMRAIAELPAGGHWSGEVRGLTLYGEPCDWDVTVMRRSEGGYVAVIRDLANRKSVERQQHMLQDQLHRAQKMEAIGVLTGGVAHDFNNILAAISGYGSLLQDDLRDRPNEAQMAQQILVAASRGAELVKSMLAFSRPDQGDFGPIDFTAACREAAAMAGSSVRGSASFEVEIEDRPLRVMGDATQIVRAIVNLCVNARDAVEGGAGAVKLEVSSTSIDGGCAEGLHKFAAEFKLAEATPMPAEKDGTRAGAIRFQKLNDGRSRAWIGGLPGRGEYIRVRVADTGSGIPFSILERMFDPFFTTKDVGRGTGLGLSSVLGVVVAHQGAIAVDTTVGKGTTIDLIFPLLAAAGTQAEAPAPAVAQPAAAAPEARRIARQVLVVDDDAAAGSALTLILERLGCEPVFCADPREALAAVREAPDAFNLVITDLTMPHLTGIELAQQLRDCGYRGHLALATGRPQDIDHAERRRFDVANVIKKPFTVMAIAETLAVIDRLESDSTPTETRAAAG